MSFETKVKVFFISIVLVRLAVIMVSYFLIYFSVFVVETLQSLAFPMLLSFFGAFEPTYTSIQLPSLLQVMSFMSRLLFEVTLLLWYSFIAVKGDTMTIATLIETNTYLGLAYSSSVESIIIMVGNIVPCRQIWCWRRSQEFYIYFGR